MKVEIGKYYRSATGVKVGPAQCNGAIVWVREFGPIWNADGTPFSDAAQDIGALIAEWVDEPQIEVGKTYPDRVGNEWECICIKGGVAFLNNNGGPAYRWKLDGTPVDYPFGGGRVLNLGPVRGEVVLYGCSVFGVAQVKSDTHKLTIPTLDGKPAVGTYTGENGLSVKIEEVE